MAATTSDGRVGDEPAVAIDVGALEAERVARRAADERHLAETLLERVRELLLVTEEPIPRRKAKVLRPSPGASARRRRRRSLPRATPSLLAEVAEALQDADDGGARRTREAGAGEAPVAAAGRPDLAGGRAAGDLHAGEPLPQRGRQLAAVVLRGAEEQHERESGCTRPSVQLGHGLSRVACARLRDADVRSSPKAVPSRFTAARAAGPVTTMIDSVPARLRWRRGAPPHPAGHDQRERHRRAGRREGHGEGVRAQPAEVRARDEERQRSAATSTVCMSQTGRRLPRDRVSAQTPATPVAAAPASPER